MAADEVRRFALIPAAGSGLRFGGATAKTYVRLAGKPLLRQTLDALADATAFETIFVVLAQEDIVYSELIGTVVGVEPLYCGGATRAESVRNGLASIGELVAAGDWILVHDAVRPCIDLASLNRLQDELADDPVGGILAIPVADTLKRVEIGAAKLVARTESRSCLWQAQTPQMFRYAILCQALRETDLTTITDEAQAVERLGMKPRVVLGSPANIKVTREEDLQLAEAILARRLQCT